MNDTIKISCNIGSTNPSAKLGIEIWVDDACLYDNPHVDSESIRAEFSMTEDTAKHQLRFVLKNKTAEHTKIDQDSNIVDDACLTISDLSFDEIKLEHLFHELTTYSHNFNGSGPETDQKFFGQMGCNGVVKFNFSTPIYLWLLENM